MANVAVIGAGPIGLYCAIMRARRGDNVVLIDRDPGPALDGSWDRRGVMQFRHPHFFRHIVGQTFGETAPDLWDAVIGAGGMPVRPPGAPQFINNLQCRRSTFEAALRVAALAQPRLAFLTGHAQRIAVEGGRVAGVSVDGAVVPADLVIDAGGRTSRLTDQLRPPGEGGSCGFSYIARMYRVLDDAATATLADTAAPMVQIYGGYLAIVFPQDARTLSALIIRASDDQYLAQLRHVGVWDAAMGAIPHLATWTEPGRFEPMSDVMPGGGLTNTYRGQPDLPGLFVVGDAVCTTNPAAARGVSLGLLQARELLSLIEQDLNTAAAEFQTWCDQQIRPWYEDHVYWDATLLRRFSGEDIDLNARIPSDIICAAADIDPQIRPAAGQYQAMAARPAILQPLEERARAALRDGWRPPIATGPTRDELAELINAKVVAT